MFSNSLPGVLRWDGDSFLKPRDGAWFDLKVLAMELRTCGWENPTKKVVFNRTYMGEKMEKTSRNWENHRKKITRKHRCFYKVLFRFMRAFH